MAKTIQVKLPITDGNNNTYNLNLPDSTSWEENRIIATTADVNLKQDIIDSNNKLDYSLIDNKPTLGTASAYNTGTTEGTIPVVGANGKLNESLIPATVISDIYEAGSEAAMLALDAKKSDMCIRSDISKTFILANTPASTLSNWVEMRTPTSTVLSVAGKTGAVTLDKSDVGLGNVLNQTITVTGTSVSDGTNTFIKYTHPTTTAQAAAAIKVGRDNLGHVILGTSLTKEDVGLGNVANEAVSLITTSGQEAVNVGSTSLNVVTTDTQQTIAGNKTFTGSLNTRSITVENTYGISANYFKDVKQIGYSQAYGAPDIELTSSNIKLYKSVLPNDANKDLGNSSLKWRDAYISRNLTDGTNSITVAQAVEKVGPTISITYTDLKALRDNNQLKPGQFYRITNYQCTTTQATTSAASHLFDIIVRADDIDTLNEEAWATNHVGDTYFSDCNLSAWKLWYCLDNDTDRFKWADPINGKGIIYRMIDEFNNDCPYDFKNILFTKSGKYTNAYTFSYTKNNEIKDASLEDNSCYKNIIVGNFLGGKFWLPSIVFYSTNSSDLLNCHDNIFESSCSSILLGQSCQRNIFKYWCYDIYLGSYCTDNTFGQECYGINLGQRCKNNTFSAYCMGINAANGYIENSCFRNISKITFSDPYYTKCYFDGCTYLTIQASTTGSSDNYARYICVHPGIRGTSSAYKLITVDRKLSYTTDVYPIGSTEMFI